MPTDAVAGGVVSHVITHNHGDPNYVITCLIATWNTIVWPEAVRQANTTEVFFNTPSPIGGGSLDWTKE